MCNHWKDEDFKNKSRINHETFNFVLKNIHANLKPFPTPPDRQLSMTLYRFATGCTYSTLPDLFGVSVSAAN